MLKTYFSEKEKNQCLPTDLRLKSELFSRPNDPELPVSNPVSIFSHFLFSPRTYLCPQTVVPPYLQFCFPQLVAHGQPHSENVKWKIPKMNNLESLNCVSFWVAWCNLSGTALCCQELDSSLCPGCPHYWCSPPIKHLVAGAPLPLDT